MVAICFWDSLKSIPSSQRTIEQRWIRRLAFTLIFFNDPLYAAGTSTCRNFHTIYWFRSFARRGCEWGHIDSCGYQHPVFLDLLGCVVLILVRPFPPLSYPGKAVFTNGDLLCRLVAIDHIRLEAKRKHLATWKFYRFKVGYVAVMWLLTTLIDCYNLRFSILHPYDGIEIGTGAYNAFKVRLKSISITIITVIGSRQAFGFIGIAIYFLWLAIMIIQLLRIRWVRLL